MIRDVRACARHVVSCVRQAGGKNEEHKGNGPRVEAEGMHGGNAWGNGKGNKAHDKVCASM